MRKIELEELKKLQLDILDVISEYCKKNNINYWLDSGTLIGAVRHNGYIPWDDDIDVGMLRKDFEKFIHTFNNYNPRYQVYNIETDSSFTFAYAKVLDLNTVLYEPNEKGNKLAVNIDVFVFDNVPDDEKERNKAFRLRDLYTLCNGLRTNAFLPNGNFIKKYGMIASHYLLMPFPKNYFAKKLSENAQKYNNMATENVGNLTGYMKQFCKREAVSKTVDHIFEGKQYKIPIGYDAWLKSFYGDYMTLPPVEKRVSHHSFIAYMK